MNEEVSATDFKKVSGGMGVYSEWSKKEFMIRLRIPSGITNIEQMNWLCDIADKIWIRKISFNNKISSSIPQLINRSSMWNYERWDR